MNLTKVAKLSVVISSLAAMSSVSQAGNLTIDNYGEYGSYFEDNKSDIKKKI